MVVAWLSASRLDSQEVYSGHMSQDGGCAGGLLVTRGTRQRRWYMNTIHVGGRRLGLDGLSTEGAGVVGRVWPDQQQAGQDTQQRKLIVMFMCSFWKKHMNIMTNLYRIHLHLFTNLYEQGENMNETSDKYTQIIANAQDIMTTLNDTSGK